MCSTISGSQNLNCSDDEKETTAPPNPDLLTIRSRKCRLSASSENEPKSI